MTPLAEKTVFKKIIDREIPANIVYEDDLCLAFHDIDPKAPVHVLLIPKKEIQNLSDADPEDQSLLGHMLLKIPEIAEQLGLDDGFRVITNNGAGGGQDVYHLHFHLMGGRKLNWPPG